MTFVKKKKKKKKRVHRSYKADTVLVCQNIDEWRISKRVCNYDMNSFRKISFSKNGVCKSRIKSCFLNKFVHYSRKLHGKVNYLIKTGVLFSLVGYYLLPSNSYRRLIFHINAFVLILIIC